MKIWEEKILRKYKFLKCKDRYDKSMNEKELEEAVLLLRQAVRSIKV